MRDLIEEILKYSKFALPGFMIGDILEGLFQRLQEFAEHESDQATELYGLSESFPNTKDWTDGKLRAWLTLVYEYKYDYQVPKRAAVEDTLSMIRAREMYGKEFFVWKDEECKRWDEKRIKNQKKIEKEETKDHG